MWLFTPDCSDQQMTDFGLVIGWTVMPSLAAGPGCWGKPCSGLDLFPMVSASARRETPGDFFRADARFFAAAFFFFLWGFSTVSALSSFWSSLYVLLLAG